VHVGAKDRRRVSTSSKSLLGIVATESNDLLGLQETNIPDAVSGVLQCRVCAEWNGMGTLPIFSKRAHRAWRIAHDLPPEEPVPLVLSSKQQRKRGSSSSSDQLLDALSPVDMVSTVLAVCFWVAIASYVWENWRDLLQHFVVVDDKSSLFYKPPPED
jgi:hypothetical protein